MIDHAEIARLIPHDGDMVLLDRVTAWDEAGIACTAVSHRLPTNPLRRADMLPAAAGIEYCAQAMALHGSLLDGSGMRQGLLASLRKVRFGVTRLDDIACDLTVAARVMLRETNSFIYAFTLSALGKTLMDGQASVFLL